MFSLVLEQFDSKQIALLVTPVISRLVWIVNAEITENGDRGACAEPAHFASLWCPSTRCDDF